MVEEKIVNIKRDQEEVTEEKVENGGNDSREKSLFSFPVQLKQALYKYGKENPNGDELKLLKMIQDNPSFRESTASIIFELLEKNNLAEAEFMFALETDNERDLFESKTINKITDLLRAGNLVEAKVLFKTEKLKGSAIVENILINLNKELQEKVKKAVISQKQMDDIYKAVLSQENKDRLRFIVVSHINQGKSDGREEATDEAKALSYRLLRDAA